MSHEVVYNREDFQNPFIFDEILNRSDKVYGIIGFMDRVLSYKGYDSYPCLGGMIGLPPTNDYHDRSTDNKILLEHETIEGLERLAEHFGLPNPFLSAIGIPHIDDGTILFLSIIILL